MTSTTATTLPKPRGRGTPTHLARARAGTAQHKPTPAQDSWPPERQQWLRLRMDDAGFSLIDAAAHLGCSVRAVQLQVAKLRLQTGALQPIQATAVPALTAYGAPILSAALRQAQQTAQAQRDELLARGLYVPPPPSGERLGAMDAARLPSRMGNRLHWPDRRVTGLDGGALA